MRGVAVIGLVMAMAAGCGGDDAGEAAATQLCEPGTSRCMGNATATCIESGLGWTVNQCGATRYCADDGQSCRDRDPSCPYAAQSSCLDPKTSQTCNATGSAVSTAECGSDICVAGTCHSTPCDDGAVECGFRTAAVCEDGVWQTTDCGEDENCEAGQCVARVCEPQSVSCKDEATARTCNVRGTGYSESACPAKEKCYEEFGVCAPVVTLDVVVDEPDVVDSDTVEEEDATVADEDDGPPPALEPLDLAEVTVDGERIVFESHKSASYVEADKDLRITMDKGSSKVEISITPIEQFDVGQWSSTAASDVSVTIFYHDGTPLVGQAQFRYVSVDYEFELVKFQSKDGRVSGTFSGTFTDDGGQTTIPFTNGKFDVKRHD